ncbi:zinc ABC transporter substrate-binding protein [Halodesulfovibrio sp.]|uniref:metal ABC transporter substrate-binding protein n=1 Tax=Halodesulfovibrio sp. TaxID=1912772 RepID=UPI0025C0E034|nr:zinc ABC transporter substrate-binding protein [Halodesulfovibrio sp.]
MMSVKTVLDTIFVWFARHSESTTPKCGFLAMLGVSSLLIAGTAFAQESALVLTSVPASYSITSQLTKETDVRVRNIPQEGRIIYSVKQYINKHNKMLKDVFSEADAVITMGNLWKKDPLYPAVRDVNIRVVNVDATRPASSTMTGVSVIHEPSRANLWTSVTGRKVSVRRPSVYCWLSLANGARMADVITSDLMRLYPDQKEQLSKNLKLFQKQIHSMRAAYDSQFAQVDNLTVFCLASEFVYLTDDAGIYVDGYMVKQDINWNSNDLLALTKRLKENDIPVVLHKWVPSEAIQKAISAGGAKLVVLNPLDGVSFKGKGLLPSTYFDVMKENYEALSRAFSDT